MVVTVSFEMAPGHQFSSIRGIGFLKGHPELDASSQLAGLKNPASRELRSRMDRWIQGDDVPKSHFHGWPNDPDYKQCFVFKYKRHRFYGYLCNPMPETNPRFRLCVLCIHALKNEKETDTAELKRVVDWSNTAGARDSIAHLFPESKEKKTWTQ